MRGWARRLKAVLWVAALLTLVGTSAMGALLWMIAQSVPDIGNLQSYRPPEKSVIFSADGQVLAELYHQNRQWAPLDTIPPVAREATLAVEDHRFYQHAGVDPVGVARALWANLLGGRVVEGGSTLTQQLARNLYLGPERTFGRKLREMVLARRIEASVPKSRILELYLNQVYYGSGAYGIRAAASVYFGKSLDQLTLAEAALLAGLPARPAQLSPFHNAAAARARRDAVLRRMAELGVASPAQAAAAASEPLRLAPRSGIYHLKRAPYFVDWVQRQVIARLGSDELYEGGLRIYTTLNLRMQRAAEAAVREGLDKGRSRGRVSQAALVALDPQSGRIVAMVGGRDYDQSQFNRAVNSRGRQPGSAFKPFLYAAALENGFTPETVLDDSPLSVSIDGRDWEPGNYDAKFRGEITLYEALIRSVNVPAIRVGMALGPDTVAHYAHALGIRANLRAVPSLAIGTSEVTPLEITAAYAPFANGGRRVAPVAVLRVEDRDGAVLWGAAPPKGEEVIATETAQTMAMLLRDVVLYGTGRSAAGVPNAAGKTGTTQDDRDAWFVGFTPELVAGVWAGNDDRSPMGGQVFGGAVPAPIWARFMRAAVPLAAAAHGKEIQDGEIASYRAHHEEELREQEEQAQQGREQQAEEARDAALNTLGQLVAAAKGWIVPTLRRPREGIQRLGQEGIDPAAGPQQKAPDASTPENNPGSADEGVAATSSSDTARGEEISPNTSLPGEVQAPAPMRSSD